MITSAELRERLNYNMKTGEFIYLVKPCQRICIGDTAGYLQHGYRNIEIHGRNYKAHRLAWLYVYGEWPSGVIDHKNGNRSDNRIENLRCVTASENAQNQRVAKRSNKIGLLGVSPRFGRFQAQIGVNGKVRKLGLFETAELAHAAYINAKRIHHAACTI